MSIDAFAAQLTGLDDDFQIFSSLGQPPDAPKIAAAERTLGMPLALEHRTLVERFGALAIAVHERAWPRVKPLEIRPSWQFAHTLYIFGVVDAPFLDVAVQARAFPPPDGRRLAPLWRAESDKFVVGYDEAGRLWSWGDGGPVEAHEPPGIWAGLAARVAALAADKQRIRAELSSS